VPQLRRLVAGFPPPLPEFESGSSHVGSVVERAALGQVSSKYFGFPCNSFIPLITPQSSPFAIQCWYNGPIYGLSNSGLGSTPTKKKGRTNTVGVSLPSPEDGNRSSIQNVMSSSYLKLWMIDKSHKPNDPDCYLPTSEPLKFDISFYICYG
jgi:hypothetical protein